MDKIMVSLWTAKRSYEVRTYGRVVHRRYGCCVTRKPFSIKSDVSITFLSFLFCRFVFLDDLKSLYGEMTFFTEGFTNKISIVFVILFRTSIVGVKNFIGEAVSLAVDKTILSTSVIYKCVGEGSGSVSERIQYYDKRSKCSKCSV